jgi:hypothetical protein
MSEEARKAAFVSIKRRGVLKDSTAAVYASAFIPAAGASCKRPCVDCLATHQEREFALIASVDHHCLECALLGRCAENTGRYIGNTLVSTTFDNGLC